MITAQAAVHLSLVMDSKDVVLYFNEKWYIECAVSKTSHFLVVCAGPSPL